MEGEKLITCKHCDGDGYNLEPECCMNFDYIERYGSCCGVPNPKQEPCKYCETTGFIIITTENEE